MGKQIFLNIDFQSPRLDYTVDFINNHPIMQGVRISAKSSAFDWELSYHATPKDNAFSIYRQNIFFADVCQQSDLYANVYTLGNLSVYSVESNESAPTICTSPVIPFDLFEAVFFHISRYEEWHCKPTQLDEWDMMKEQEQFLVYHGLEKRPIVDQLIFFLRSVFDSAAKVQASTLVLTHDIDHLRKFSPLSLPRKIVGHLYRGEKLKHLPRLIKDYFNSLLDRKNDPYNNLGDLFSESFRGRKIVFLIVGGTHAFDPAHKSDTALRAICQLANEREYEIGLHPSYECNRDQRLLQSEHQRLSKISGSIISQSRQHYLHFSFRETPKILLSMEIDHDFSMGYNRRVGFRCGTGYPYAYYDFTKERESNLICHPLAFMDSSCFHESGQEARAFETILTDFINQNRGNTNLVVNFHNSFLDTAVYYDIPIIQLYRELLDSFPTP